MTMWTLLIVLAALNLHVFGKNDWSKPCLGGSCSFDVEESSSSMGGSVQFSGSSSAISDITPAAGWQVLNCTDSTNNQTIRLACLDESKGCEHLFLNGAQHTVIRLPADCGSGPFVRVADHRISKNQTLPSGLAQNLTRRYDGALPQVHELDVDDDFDQDASPHGSISFKILSKGTSYAASRRSKRELASVEPIDVSDAEGQTINMGVPAQTPIFDDAMECECPLTATPVLGEVSISIGVGADMELFLEFLAEGIVMPFNISFVQYSALTNATIEGSGLLNVDLLQGVVTGSTTVLQEVILPPLTLPGTLTMTPILTMSTSPSAVIQGLQTFQTGVNVEYEIINLQFAYPMNIPPSTVNVTRSNSFAEVTVTPSEFATSQFAMDVTFELSNPMTLFGVLGDVDVKYRLGFDTFMSASPASDEGNIIACTTALDTIILEVDGTGTIFTDVDAGSMTLFQDSETILEFCGEAPLGTSPSMTRRSEERFEKRSTDENLECPTFAVTALSPIASVTSVP